MPLSNNEMDAIVRDVMAQPGPPMSMTDSGAIARHAVLVTLRRLQGAVSLDKPLPKEDETDGEEKESESCET